MQNQVDYPQWVLEALVEDEAFAEAYDQLSPQKRALLKSAIARLWLWCGPSETVSELARTDWRQGLSTVSCARPRPGCLLIMGQQTPSPARVLAGLVPALAAGVESVLVARPEESGPVPSAVLTALELAGQEYLAELPGQRIAELAEWHAGQGAIVLDLGSGLTADVSPDCVWTAPLPGPVGVWLDGGEDDPDIEVLAFAQPGVAFEVMGECPAPLPEYFEHCSGTFDDFLDRAQEGAFVPRTRFEAALAILPLVFGPGLESSWVYLPLTSALFQSAQAGWLAADQPTET